MNENVRWIDLFSAQRVLDGDWVLIVPHLPDGYHRHGVKQPPISEEDLRTLVRNFENRATSGYYLSTVPFNKEHRSSEGKIGAVSDLDLRLAGEPEEQGVYGKLELTKVGQTLLEDEAFDYLSPEIRRKTVDTQTGEDLGMSLAGLGATNYPYFGDRTAMYSSAAVGKIGVLFTGMQRILDTWSAMHDGEGSEEETIEAADGNDGAEASGTATDRSHDSEEDNSMSGNNQEELFAQMADRLAALEASDAENQGVIEEYRETIEGQAERLQDADQEIARLSHARIADRFVHEAETFSALGADNGDFASHLTWLYLSDTPGDDGERAHFSFFTALLRQADVALQDSEAFRDSGAEGGDTSPSAFTTVEKRIKKLAAERELAAEEGSENYTELLGEVLRADPQLYEQYRTGVVSK